MPGIRFLVYSKHGVERRGERPVHRLVSQSGRRGDRTHRRGGRAARGAWSRARPSTGRHGHGLSFSEHEGTSGLHRLRSASRPVHLRTAILLLGGNKAGQWQAWYTENIPIADQRYREYLAELRQEGLIE